jgi:aspartate/methionine/tyrosine aminotransferase
MRSEFERRSRAFVDGLNRIRGFHALMPKGAFYVFANIEQTGWSSKAVADSLLDEAGVAGLSGTSFGRYGEGFVRFSVANSMENLMEALRRIESWAHTNL